jgi:hypothetical protein
VAPGRDEPVEAQADPRADDQAQSNLQRHRTISLAGCRPAAGETTVKRCIRA